MKKIMVLVVLLVSFALVGSAFALMKQKEVVKDTKQGKVTFVIQNHKDKGAKCGDCHDKLFEKKMGALSNPAPHKAGEKCGGCHDGKKAFSVEDTATCGNCHKK